MEDQISNHIFPCLAIETFLFASKLPRGTVSLFPGSSVVLLIKQRSKQKLFVVYSFSVLFPRRERIPEDGGPSQIIFPQRKKLLHA